MRVANEDIRNMIIDATEAARTQMNTAMAKILERWTSKLSNSVCGNLEMNSRRESGRNIRTHEKETGMEYEQSCTNDE